MCVHLLLNMCPLCRARLLALQIETSINQTEKKREAAIEKKTAEEASPSIPFIYGMGKRALFILSL